MIAKNFVGRTENDVKNRFYTTLKRVATQAQLEDPIRYSSQFVKCKQNLLQFVDSAIQHEQVLSSKRGRKRNSDKAKARKEGIIFPKLQSSSQSMQFPMMSSMNIQLPIIALCPVQPIIQYAVAPLLPCYAFPAYFPHQPQYLFRTINNCNSYI